MVTWRFACAKPRRASGAAARPAAMPTRCRNCRLDVRLLDMCGGYGDCHTPLPREVRKCNDTTPRTCSLHVQGGQECWLLPPPSQCPGQKRKGSDEAARSSGGKRYVVSGTTALTPIGMGHAGVVCERDRGSRV